MTTYRNLGAGLLLAAVSVLASAQVGPQLCGSLENAVGPLDYRNGRRDVLKLVETYHFTPKVEMALRGEQGYLGQDLDYTLRAFPNHHRALATLQRLQDRIQSGRGNEQLPRPVECYYERAVRWRPDDVVARMLYAQFLFRERRANEATAQLTAAEANAQDNAMTHYNIGMVYFEGKDYARARVQAKRALELGFERPMLKDQLAAIGQWDAAPDAAAEPPAAAASR